MGLLNVHTAAMLAQGARAIEAVSVPLPQSHHVSPIADNQLEIVRVDVACFVWEGIFFDFRAIITTLPEVLVAVGFVTVIADVNTIGVPVLVSDTLPFFFAGTDFPDITCVHIQAPNAIVDQRPRPFVAEGEQMWLRRVRC